MSSTARTEGSAGSADAATISLQLEVVVIPVTDVDRARDFYAGTLGWRLDADFAKGDFRIVQLTPPRSGCSIQFGSHVSRAAAGTAENLYLIVADIDEARSDLIARGVEVGAVFHESELGARFNAGTGTRLPGADPNDGTYASFASFSDPDGNSWLLQQITERLPGRIDPAETTYTSASDLQEALIRAATAHGEHEKRTGQADAEWPVWYARYMVAERGGTELPR